MADTVAVFLVAVSVGLAVAGRDDAAMVPLFCTLLVLRASQRLRTVACVVCNGTGRAPAPEDGQLSTLDDGGRS